MGGMIDSKGPRYCPSIEDKIVRFADKDSHQIFLEREGRDTPEIYVQGFSSGYEEAEDQDLVTGLNAARLIGDLVSQDLREPYRVLTSQSEYRLILQGDKLK